MVTKSALRAELKALRDGIGADERATRSRSICTHLERLCRDRHISRIGAFWPLGSEVDLRTAVAGHPDWLWFFPRVSSTHPPRLVWGTEPLEPGPWGLMEPAFAQHLLPPVQLLLVPGLAFDHAGYRIGYGGGFYDALLPHLPDGVLTVGVGFEAQLNLDVPVEPQDWPVQGLLSEQGLEWLEQ